MTKKILSVPYVSRYVGESKERLDSGACCVAMLLGAMTQPTSAQDVVAASEGRKKQLSPAALIRGAQALGLTMFKDKGRTLADLKRLIDDGQPPIVLLKYGDIPDRLERQRTGAHYVVVVGYDDREGVVFINDPHYPEADEADNGGYRRAYAYQTFWDAWGGAGFSLLVPVPMAPPPPPPDGAFSFGVVATQGDVWVIAPIGLRLRAQPAVSAGSVADGVPFGQHLAALSPESGPDANGYFWQQILTDQGITAWVAAGAGGERYLSPTPPVTPATVYVLDTQPVRAAGGLGLRESRDVTLTPTERVSIGSPLVVYQRVTESDSTPWLWVKTPSETFGWGREKAEGVTLVGSIPSPAVTPVTPPPAAVSGFLSDQPDVRELPLAPATPLILPSGASVNMGMAARIWNAYGGLLGPLAARLGTDPAVAVAVVAAESGGRSSGPDGRMIIRFENHIFWSNWGKYHPDTFNTLFQFSANRSWEGHLYRPSPDAAWREFHGNPIEEWNVLGVAQRLDDAAAKLSISMGLVQIMGFNYTMIGYPTIQAMFKAFSADIRMQLLGFFDFVKSRGAIPAMQTRDFVRFALLYNGQGQEVTYGAIIQRYYDAFQALKSCQ